MTVYEISGEDETYVAEPEISEKIRSSYEDDLYMRSPKKVKSRRWKKASGYSALDELVCIAKERGASGVINLKIVYHYNYISEEYRILDRVEVSGMLIRK